MEQTSRATLSQYSVDNALTSYKKGDISVMEVNAELERIKNLVDNDIQKVKTDIISSKYPKSNSYDNGLKLVGEAQRTRAYNLLSQDISVIRNEMKRGIDENNYDFVFTLAESCYHNDKFSRVEQHSLDKIFGEALQKRGILEKATEKKKLEFLQKELDAVLSKVGTMDADKLVHDAQFERSRFNIVMARQNDERPKLPISELISEL